MSPPEVRSAKHAIGGPGCVPPPQLHSILSSARRAAARARLWGATRLSPLPSPSREHLERSLIVPRYLLQPAALQGGQRAPMGLAKPRIANTVNTAGAVPSNPYSSTLSSIHSLYSTMFCNADGGINRGCLVCSIRPGRW